MFRQDIVLLGSESVLEKIGKLSTVQIKGMCNMSVDRCLETLPVDVETSGDHFRRRYEVGILVNNMDDCLVVLLLNGGHRELFHFLSYFHACTSSCRRLQLVRLHCCKFPTHSGEISRRKLLVANRVPTPGHPERIAQIRRLFAQGAAIFGGTGL